MREVEAVRGEEGPHEVSAVEKLRGEEDARIVYVTLTKQGKKIDSVHRYFHESMVRSIISGMSEQEQQVLYQGILKLDLFLKKKISE